MRQLNRLWIPVLGVLVAIIAGGEARAAPGQTQCGLFFGTCGAGEPIYQMKFCNEVSLNAGYCRRLCERQAPICDTDGFAPWMDAYSDKGNGTAVTGALVDQGDRADDQGVLAFTSERKVVVCARSKGAAAPAGPWFPIRDKVCPKVGDVVCGGGTVRDPKTNTCETVTANGASGVSDFANLIAQSQILVSTQNQHFASNAEIQRDGKTSAVTANPMPGLTDPSRGRDGERDVAARAVSAGAATRSRASGSLKSAPTASAGLGAGGSTLAMTEATGVAKGGEAGLDDPMLAAARAALAEGKDGFSATGAGTAGAGGHASGSGTSWFGAGSAAATPGEGGGAEIGFDGSRGTASSGETLAIDDPANYFMMSDMQVSLFKRVTAQCRKKERALTASRAP